MAVYLEEGIRGGQHGHGGSLVSRAPPFGIFQQVEGAVLAVGHLPERRKSGPAESDILLCALCV